MQHVMPFKDAIQGAVQETSCRFQSLSEAQSGSGWKRYRVDYQRPSGRRERVFVYLFEKSTDESIKESVIKAIRYQEELSVQIQTGMAESA